MWISGGEAVVGATRALLPKITAVELEGVMSVPQEGTLPLPPLLLAVVGRMSSQV